MTRHHLLRSAKRALRRWLAIFKWAVSAAPAINYPGRKLRLLLIYDFASQPFSVGDILIFQEAALVLRENYDLDVVDMALVYDSSSPVVKDQAFSHIEPDSFLFHLSSVLPAAQVNPHIGSLLLFDSHRRLESYIADNRDDYLIWPRFGDYISREYLFYKCFNELFSDYYAKHGALPVLQSRPAATSWARQFLIQHVTPAVPVSVQLRRNPATPARNSDYESWYALFQYCAKHYPVKFVVICAATEVDTRFRNLTNVVIAKDFHTSLEQDLALIEASSIHMGPSSGPGTMAIFGTKPYCMFGFDTRPSMIKGFVHQEHRVRYQFANENQYFLRQIETRDILLREFDHLWVTVNNSSNIVCTPIPTMR